MALLFLLSSIFPSWCFLLTTARVPSTTGFNHLIPLQNHSETTSPLVWNIMVKQKWHSGLCLKIVCPRASSRSLRFMFSAIKLGQRGVRHRIWVNKVPINKYKQCPRPPPKKNTVRQYEKPWELLILKIIQVFIHSFINVLFVLLGGALSSVLKNQLWMKQTWDLHF